MSEEKTPQYWGNIIAALAIIVGLAIHGALISYQIGRLTQLVSDIDSRLSVVENQSRQAQADKIARLLDEIKELKEQRTTGG